MATGRGITDTKIYDHQAVIDRYGIAPELIPDFYGLKGDTSDNIPGVPGIGDKTASDLLQRFGSLEEVLAHIDDISGAKRKENLTEHADNARLSKVLATIKLDVPVEIDPVAEAAREPDRARLRDVFREFELRAPLARLEEAFGEGDAAAPRAGGRGHGQGPRARRLASPTWRASSAARRSRSPSSRPETPEGQLVPHRHPLALRRGRRARTCSSAPATGREELVAALGDRPVVAHDAKELGVVPPGLTHDTVLAAYLLEPARRGFPFREICEERGLASDVEDQAGADAVVLQALAAWQREQLARPRAGVADGRGRAAARGRAARHGGRRRAPRPRAPGRGRQARARRDPRPRARDLDAGRRGVRHRLAPAARRRCCSRSSACRASAAARPASRPTPASCRPSATSTRSSPRSSAGASSTRSSRPTSTCCRS